MPIFSIIVAAAENGVIGDSVNKHLWTVEADAAHFFGKIEGRPVIVGRKTLQAMGKMMPKAPGIVVTRDTEYQAPAPNYTVAGSVEEAFEKAENFEGEVFIIGGGEIYRQALPFTDKIYLTRVHKSPKGDVVFDFEPDENWREVRMESHGSDENNEVAYDFIDYEREPGAGGSAENTNR